MVNLPHVENLGAEHQGMHSSKVKPTYQLQGRITTINEANVLEYNREMNSKQVELTHKINDQRRPSEYRPEGLPKNVSPLEEGTRPKAAELAVCIRIRITKVVYCRKAAST
ncbi:hypothetical protein Dsin_010496 [Dipteronia sinensis]|uniref:Uncharacterized protein n=1 Tax=Dipteronia sinensis TaxID=43782 RepID=A0AAE0ASN1_9ROSI|nr:hypothetical protein Dsin_010496 [Dipteronia sinensis]